MNLSENMLRDNIYEHKGKHNIILYKSAKYGTTVPHTLKLMRPLFLSLPAKTTLKSGITYKLYYNNHKVSTKMLKRRQLNNFFN